MLENNVIAPHFPCVWNHMVEYWFQFETNVIVWFPMWYGFSPGVGGVLKFGFGDVPPRNFESRPIQIPRFQEKWPIHIQIGPIFCPIVRFFQNLFKFEQVLIKTWKKKIEKSIPFIYQTLRFVRGHSSFILSRGWFCYPFWRHVPVGDFVLSIPPISRFTMLWISLYESIVYFVLFIVYFPVLY